MHPEFRQAMARDRQRELQRALRHAPHLQEAVQAEARTPGLSWRRAEGHRRRLIAAWTTTRPSGQASS
jgi:hypothetical protein